MTIEIGIIWSCLQTSVNYHEVCVRNLFKHKRRIPFGVVANLLNCNTVVSEFELQSGYHTNIQTNTLGKGMKRLIPPVMG